MVETADLTAMTSTSEAALAYARRGWSVIPVPHRSKNPGISGWQRMRLTPENVLQHFNDDPQNIGVLLGEPSDWVVDVDLDHMRAVELAPHFLPPTPAIFGRAGKPLSHWFYKATAPIASKRFKSKSAGCIVEIRSTGLQTVVPPSTHEDGDLICWSVEDAEPAEIDPAILRERVQLLAQAVQIELGERQPPAVKKGRKTEGPVSEPDPAYNSSTDRSGRCLQAMLRIRVVDQNDGSHRLFAVACRAVEHDLDDVTAVSVIREYANRYPFPRPWSDVEILQRVRDAERQCRRGQALEVENDGCVVLGERDPVSGRLVLSSKRTLPTAAAYVREFHLHPDGRTLHCHGDVLLQWQHNHYCELEDNAVRQRLQAWLHDALRYIVNRKTDEPELVAFESNPGSVRAALDSIRSYTHLDVAVTSPAWIGSPHLDLPPHEILPCRSVLLHLPSMQRYPATPLFFSRQALEFDPDPQAPEPQEWFRFLHTLFDGDLESLSLLQEWFGYCLTGDTSQQKMLLIVGPKRSGKGTIARVLARLIGPASVCGPTTTSLAGPFGLQPLIGKTLAIVSDARFHGENITTVVERLLCISGEDTLTVDRKHMTSLSLKLSTRFLFLTNELPRCTDVSGALAGRFIILRLQKSFYGQEDIGLTERLLHELPGILNWAIEGWGRLHQRGHFAMPDSVRDVVQELEDLSSPINAFVRAACVVGPGHRATVDALYEAWKQWCEREGWQSVSTKQVFGRDLGAAVQNVKRRRGSGQQPFYEGIALKTSRP